MNHLEPNLLWIAQVGGARCDRAFDREHADWARLGVRYLRTRAKADLDALPLREGRKPRLYAVRLLSPAEYAALSAIDGESERLQSALRVGCHVRREPDGAPVEAQVDQPRPGTRIATEAWVSDLAKVGGLDLAHEIGTVVLRRAQIGDVDDPEALEELARDPFAGFGLPRGVALAR